MQFSPDGQWFWDGAQWRAAYSPDLRWRWDGNQWVPAPSQLSLYLLTAWTRRLHLIVLGLGAFGILLSVISLPTVLLPLMQQSMDQTLRTQAQEFGVDPSRLQVVMQTMLYTTLFFGAALGVGLAVLTVVSGVRVRRWHHWMVTIIYLFALISLIQDIGYVVGLPPIPPPIPVLVTTMLLGLGEGVLSVWLIMLHRQYGTWARTHLLLQP
ncbi:MAG: hypothetical protein J2P28_16750 [Actinobacteria bacterium]|nr:hypothetical protein [Actinomycetota bacterium]